MAEEVLEKGNWFRWDSRVFVNGSEIGIENEEMAILIVILTATANVNEIPTARYIETVILTVTSAAKATLTFDYSAHNNSSLDHPYSGFDSRPVHRELPSVATPHAQGFGHRKSLL